MRIAFRAWGASRDRKAPVATKRVPRGTFSVVSMVAQTGLPLRRDDSAGLREAISARYPPNDR